jgi:hypothetical protein
MPSQVQLHSPHVDRHASDSEVMNRALSDFGRIFPAANDEFAAQVRAELDAIAKPKARWTSLYLIGDPLPIRQTCDATLVHPSQGDWALISESFCDHFGCEDEDIEMVETDDGDRIAVRGEIVGYLVREVR